MSQYILLYWCLYAADVLYHNELQFNAVLADTTLLARVCKGRLNSTYDDVHCSI